MIQILMYELGDFSEAKYISNSRPYVGIHQDITKKHIDYFIEKVEEILNFYYH